MSTIPNTSDALEQAVITRLQNRFTELEVEAFPDDPEEYRLNHHLGALLVRYHGSKFGPLLDSDLVVQERVMALEVTLVFRCLNGKEGVYAYLEAVRLALAGFKPPAFTKLKPIGEEFISQDGGQWRYAIDFATTTTVIEEDEPEPVIGSQIQNVSFI
jgi:hypothetical protein